MSEKPGPETLSWSTSSAVGSPARTFPARERALALLESAAACGLNLPGSSRSFGQLGLLSRTSPAGQASGLTQSWPGWQSGATLRYRSLCRQRMSALTTSAGGSLLLPTPTIDGNYNRPKVGTSSGYGLRSFVVDKMMPTPTASLADKGAASPRVRPSGTPQSRDLRETLIDGGYLPTPCARDHKGSPGGGDGASLPRALGQSTRCLNPRFVEWMLGFPAGWVEPPNSEPSGTPPSPSAPKSSGG
jgi:hypothetical protein